MFAYNYLLAPEDKTSQNEVVIPVYRKKVENNNNIFELMKIRNEDRVQVP